MLSFNDAGLAHLFIAATSCAPEARSRWLKLVAERLEAAAAPRTPAPATLRQRHHRARRQRGEIVLRVHVNETDLAAALAGSGALPAVSNDDRRRLEEAVSELLRDWCAAWR